MGFFIGLLTVVMVLDCAALILLVLIQLPKKDAGAGLAFGGAASDALFGAGSGNVLTKVTKYAAAIFFALAIFLSFIQTHYQRSGVTSFQKGLLEGGNTPATLPAGPGPAAATRPSTAPVGSNVTVLPPGVESTTLPAAP